MRTRLADLNLKLRVAFDGDIAPIEAAIRSLVRQATVLEPLLAALDTLELEGEVILAELESSLDSAPPMNLRFGPAYMREFFDGNTDRVTPEGPTYQEVVSGVDDETLYHAMDSVLANAEDLYSEQNWHLAEAVRLIYRTANEPGGS